MNPKSRLRSPARGGSLSPAPPTPWSRYEPVVGRSRQPMMLSSVVLPDPDAPTTATHSPTSTSRSTSRSATTGATAPNVPPTSPSWTIGRAITSATHPPTPRPPPLPPTPPRLGPRLRPPPLAAPGGRTHPRKARSHGHDLDPFT